MLSRVRIAYSGRRCPYVRLGYTRANVSHSSAERTQSNLSSPRPRMSPIEAEQSKKRDGPSGSSIDTSEHQRRTMKEQDADHLEKMREAMGGADTTNIEIEDGVPDRGMKRNVRENMFRII